MAFVEFMTDLTDHLESIDIFVQDTIEDINEDFKSNGVAFEELGRLFVRFMTHD